ncbi:MAG: UvrD-helicase domain-containing protein, partial [Cyanobacteria bacterium P01_G01_bin.49]
MLELKKIVQIIQAWLAYIRLEELTQAEVERGSELYPKVADEGVQLVGNKLVLSNEVFKQFQQQQRAVEKGGRPNDFQMAVAFPQIYLVQGRGKEQKLKYLPCFTIDISKIFSSKYRKTGWDLNEFEFQPVIVNLMRLYGLEEENAESLIVTEGIFKFLEDVFTRKFSTLHDFTDQVDLPEGKYKTSRQPYLLRCDFAPYNAQLKQDLREILEQLQVSSDDCEWLDKNHPAIQYIYNSPQLPQNEVMFWGAFPSHVPDSFQATALKHSQQNYITAVHGSPGTGKTELFLHKVAHQIVERALIIAHDKEDACNLTLFASTNNSAIQKFQQRISDKFPDKHLYLDGGSQGIIRRLTIPKLQSSLDDLRATEFNQLRWEETKLDLLAAEQKIQEIIEKDSIDKTQKAANTQKRLQLEEQIQSLKHEITATEEEQQIIKEKISRLGDYNGFPYDAYEQIKQNLVKAEQELPKESDSITKRAFDLINFTSDKLVLKRLENRISTAILNTFATPYPFQIPLDRESLAASQIEVNRKLGFLQQWQNLNKRAVQLQNQLTVLNQQLELKQTDCEQIKIKLNSYQDEDCCTRFYQDSH